VVALQVGNLLIQVLLVYFPLVRHRAVFILEWRLFEAFLRNEICLRVVQNFNLSFVFADIFSGLHVVLEQLSRVVNSVTLAHVEV